MSTGRTLAEACGVVGAQHHRSPRPAQWLEGEEMVVEPPLEQVEHRMGLQASGYKGV